MFTLINQYLSTKKLNASADLPEALLEELVDLVESPLLLQGSLDQSFLELPAEVLSTVMRVHQRYIPLYKSNAKRDPLALSAKASLLPTFLCVSNGLPSAENVVRILPPLNVKKNEIDIALKIINKVCKDLK